MTTAPAASFPSTAPPGLKAWVLAARPRTLVVGAVPVLAGTALAFAAGARAPWQAAAALLGALLIQVGTNLANDHYDHVRGADGPDRLGPSRASASGWLAPSAVKRAALACFAAAIASGTFLVASAGRPVVVIGLASVLAGFAYTGGPYPLGYHGLGDVFVLTFFGLVAVGGTYFVQTGSVSAEALATGVAVGALGVAILAVNNLRDRHTDARVGKRTLAVRLGPTFARLEYTACVATAFAVPLGLALASGRAWLALPLAAAPLAVPGLRLVWTRDGGELNGALAATARLMSVWGVLFTLGVLR